MKPADVHTLLSTNNAHYTTACALDFAHPPSYYDTFALRDITGRPTATQTWPYFHSRASRRPTQHFLPVPVSSCWNGMVAMSAAPFLDPASPLRFRAVPDSLAERHVEGSECCLIHADNAARDGIFVNPNVRVAYSADAYAAVQRPMSVFAMWRGLWWNRGARWLSLAWVGESLVGRVVRAWMKEIGRASCRERVF